jgi:hypothetical protein
MNVGLRIRYAASLLSILTLLNPLPKTIGMHKNDFAERRQIIAQTVVIVSLFYCSGYNNHHEQQANHQAT